MAGTSGKIFVSHASDDEPYATKFVNEILTLGCQVTAKDKILYTSQRGTGFKTGKNLFEVMKKEAAESPLVIAIVSPAYLTRPTCIAEMGAAWVLDTLFPILTPGVKRADLTGPLKSMLIDQFDEQDDGVRGGVLDEIFDAVKNSFGHNPDATIWNQHRMSWLAHASNYANLLSTPNTYSADQMNKVTNQLDAQVIEHAKLLEAHDTLQQQYNDLLKAKTKDQIKAATMPKEETGQFHKLADEVKTYFRDQNLPRCVIKAIRYDVSNQDLILPGTFDDDDNENPDFYKAADRGLLQIDAEPPAEVTVNNDHPVIEGALKRVEAFVHWFDSGDRSEEFHVWFKDKYKLPVSSRNADVWDVVLT